MAEQLTLNQWVLGSSPRRCTKRKAPAKTGAFSCVIALCPSVVGFRDSGKNGDSGKNAQISISTAGQVVFITPTC